MVLDKNLEVYRLFEGEERKKFEIRFCEERCLSITRLQQNEDEIITFLAEFEYNVQCYLQYEEIDSHEVASITP